MNCGGLNRWLNHVCHIHFDPDSGSRYWLEKANELGIRPREDVRSIDDLVLFGPMDGETLSILPVEDFVPRRYWTDRSEWVIAETSGTTGKPKTTVYLEREFYTSFVQSFELVAAYRKFPTNENWLYIGPTGPHIIGRAARACARALHGPDPFSVDFDPRWARKFAPDSIGFKRYLDHVIEQSMRIVDTQHIGVLFSTPKVLIRLKEVMTAQQREAILGVHFGGMQLEQGLFQAIAEAFPKAVFISGYGNTLFGMCPEFKGKPDHPLDYYPLGSRLIFGTVPLENNLTPQEKLEHPCGPGESGQLVFSRLDEGFLLINYFERDQGELIAPGDIPREYQCFGFGIRNPRPLRENTSYVPTGLY
jgi:thienamycin biosynthesis protein ThnN